MLGFQVHGLFSSDGDLGVGFFGPFGLLSDLESAIDRLTGELGMKDARLARYLITIKGVKIRQGDLAPPWIRP